MSGLPATPTACCLLTCVSLLTLSAIVMICQAESPSFSFRPTFSAPQLAENPDHSVECQCCREAPAALPFVSVVVVATSAANWMDRRKRIRSQFPQNVALIKDSNNSALLKFAIGTRQLDKQVQSAAQHEATEHKDILFFDCSDLDDGLNHLQNWHLGAGPSATTSKVMLSVQWAVQHYTFDFFFRLGDDSYFRVDRFLHLQSSGDFPMHNAVVGRMESGYVFDMQQTYPQGAGYALTYDVCTFIAANTAYLMDTAPEDCVVARWLFALGARFVHSPLWRDMSLGESCQEDMVLAHKLSPGCWANIKHDGTVTC